MKIKRSIDQRIERRARAMIASMWTLAIAAAFGVSFLTEVPVWGLMCALGCSLMFLICFKRLETLFVSYLVERRLKVINRRIGRFSKRRMMLLKNNFNDDKLFTTFGEQIRLHENEERILRKFLDTL